MPDIQGDASQDEIDDQIKAELAAGLGSATDTNPVRLSAAAAARILELLGGPPKPKAEQTGKVQAADDEDHSAKRRK